MTEIEIIENICTIPRRFRIGSKSFRQLIDESGLTPDSAPSLDRVEQFIADRDELVQDWLQWSEDKRSSDGAYFLLRPDGAAVGQIGSSIDQLVFASVPRACATFILAACGITE